MEMQQSKFASVNGTSMSLRTNSTSYSTPLVKSSASQSIPLSRKIHLSEVSGLHSMWILHTDSRYRSLVRYQVHFSIHVYNASLSKHFQIILFVGTLTSTVTVFVTVSAEVLSSSTRVNSMRGHVHFQPAIFIEINNALLMVLLLSL